MKFTLTPKTALLLLLNAHGPHAPREPVVGKTRMMKLVFLFEKELYPKLAEKDMTPLTFDFRAYDYGPFSDTLYRELLELESLQLISIAQLADDEPDDEAELVGDLSTEADVSESSDDIGDVSYAITDRGQRFLDQRIYNTMTPRQIEAIDGFKKAVLAASLRSLLRYVYTQYPESATESKIRGKLLGSRYLH